MRLGTLRLGTGSGRVYSLSATTGDLAGNTTRSPRHVACHTTSESRLRALGVCAQIRRMVVGGCRGRLLPGGTVLGWPRRDDDVKDEAKDAPRSGDRQGQRAQDEGAEDEWVHE